MTRRVRLAALGAVSAMLFSTAAWAADPASCKNVRFSDVGWTDITSTTAATSVVLKALGYNPSAKVLSVPVTYKGLSTGEIDVFLGNWMPTMEGDIAKYREKGSVETIAQQLVGAKYTLAVNKLAADGGIKSFGDIAKYSKQLEGKIYGIEPGNDGNRLIQDMIDENAFGLKGFELVESSEAGHAGPGRQRGQPQESVDRLPGLGAASDERQVRDGLSRDGGDDWFGPNFGGAEVFTNTPQGLRQRLPERRQAAEEPRSSRSPWRTRSWAAILDGRQEPQNDAATAWLKANPGVLTGLARGRDHHERRRRLGRREQGAGPRAY